MRSLWLPRLQQADSPQCTHSCVLWYPYTCGVGLQAWVCLVQDAVAEISTYVLARVLAHLDKNIYTCLTYCVLASLRAWHTPVEPFSHILYITPFYALHNLHWLHCLFAT